MTNQLLLNRDHSATSAEPGERALRNPIMRLASGGCRPARAVCFLLALLVTWALPSTAFAQGVTNHGADKIDATGPAALDADTLNAKHILEPGDQVSFQILEDKKPATNLVVTDSTELSVPYIGRISVAGKTCEDVAADVKPALEKTYYYAATVVIGLNSVNKVKGHVLVWGEVKNQGAIDMLANHSLTVGEAILAAGGLTEDADRRKVKVVRHRPNGTSETSEVNMTEVMENGKVDSDMKLNPGDSVIVPTRLLRF